MTETGGITVRFLLYLDLMLLFGLPLFGLYALRGGERADASILRLRALTVMLAVLALILSAMALILLAASMAGLSPLEVDRETVALLLTGTQAGTAWLVRAAALLAALVLPLIGWRRPGLALMGVVLAAAIALSTLPWTGHGAMDEGIAGWVHLSADIVHLLASGVWIGALGGLVLLIFRPVAGMSATHVALSHRALEGFSDIGTGAVALIVLTGLVNGWFLVGIANLGAMVTALYGQLLSAKLLLFLGMLVLAAINRFRLTPALADGGTQAAIGALRRSLFAETGLAVTILALVAWLGTLSPPASGV